MTTEEEQKEIELRKIKEQLVLFFPEDAYSFTRAVIEDGVDAGEILTDPVQILPYIQTALL